MYVVTVDFIVHPNDAQRFVERVGQQAADSLGANRTATCSTCAPTLKIPPEFFYTRDYEDRGAFDLHLESEHFKAFDTKVRDWVRDKKVRLLHRLD